MVIDTLQELETTVREALSDDVLALIAFVVLCLATAWIASWFILRVRHSHRRQISIEKLIGPNKHKQRKRWYRVKLPRVHPLAYLILAAVLFYGYEQFPVGSDAWTIKGRVTHVRDGDTIEVSGTAIRFSSLDCAERGTVAGDRTTRRMRELVAGQRLTRRLTGRRSYDRMIGKCDLPDGRDLGRVMIREGICGRWW